MLVVLVYILLPLFLSFMTLFQNKKVMVVLSLATMTILSLVSLYMVANNSILELHVSQFFDTIIILLDGLLLVYFIFVGAKYKSFTILILALVQLLLYSYCESQSIDTKIPDILIDTLSAFMLIIINLIGSLIVIYSYTYMEYEQTSKSKKLFFISYLWFFIAVMNMVVMANNLLLFFFFFELTTLSSYLLIKFRNDEISVKNALNALLINQIGGVFLLIGIAISLHGGIPLYFSEILRDNNVAQIIIICLVFAAFVKGAMIPFESWLLGAMVAPTPVSAILHSATMVKIAPFLILKLAPALSQTSSIIISIYASFVFFSAMLKALDKDNFKEILAYSTIAMLALMICIAAIGTPQSHTIVLYLIFFHALSKAILFMCAGILEKVYAIKSINDFENLISKSPKLAILIIISFASLTLPPFGLFFAKVFSLVYLSSLISSNPLYIIVLLFLILGSSLMMLLYFKVTSLMLASKRSQIKEEGTTFEFLFASYMLFVFMLISIVFIILSNLNISIYFIVAFSMLVVFFIFSLKLPLLKIDRAKEYFCGEKAEQNIGNFYFNFDRTKKTINIISVLFLISLIIGGLL